MTKQPSLDQGLLVQVNSLLKRKEGFCGLKWLQIPDKFVSVILFFIWWYEDETLVNTTVI